MAKRRPGDDAAAGVGGGAGVWVPGGSLPWRQSRPVLMILVLLAERGMQGHSAAGSAGPADLSSWYHVVRLLLHSAHGSLVHKVRRSVGYLPYPR